MRLANNPRGAFGLASSLADPDDPDQGVLGGMRLAGDVFDNAMGNNTGNPMGGLVGAVNGGYDHDKVMEIIGLAGDDMDRVINKFENRANMYREMSDDDQALLGV